MEFRVQGLEFTYGAGPRVRVQGWEFRVGRASFHELKTLKVKYFRNVVGLNGRVCNFL